MKRHRKAANAVRILLGRGLFACGPKVTRGMQLPYVFQQREKLEEHATDDESEEPAVRRRYSTRTSVTRSEQALVAARALTNHRENSNENVPNQTMTQVVSTVERGNAQMIVPGGSSINLGEGADHISRETPTTDRRIDQATPRAQGYTSRDENLVLSPSSPCNVEYLEQPELRDSRAISHHRSDDSGSLEVMQGNMDDEEAISNRIVDGEDFDEDVSRIPGFFQWLRSIRVWISFYLKHGPTYSEMDDILSNINAPCKNWKTVMDNVEKASGIRAELQSYPICPEHMCFANLSGTEELLSCTICGKPKESVYSGIQTVTYIPILPRIMSIVRNESMCNDMYSYRRERTQESDLMSDFFDSPAYEDFLCEHGAEERCKFDLFITVSTDGFQVYKNRRCDVWPVVAALMNLSPSRRYAARNVMPLMFIPGPKEPKDLQSFLIPLINELNEIYDGDGTSIRFYDGVERSIRIHLIWFTADLAAMRKLASLTGVRGKSPCRFCLIQGYYIPSCRGYYFPSWLHKDDDVTKRLSLFNIRRLPRRSLASIDEAILKLQRARNQSEREVISRETGIQGRSLIDELSSVTLFTSFPPDIMHLFYNVQRLLFRHLLGSLEDLSLTENMIEVLDEELMQFGTGISGQISPSPRRLSEWHNWKAAEHKAFTISYCLILFDGYLRADLLNGLAKFSELSDICFRYSITTSDVEKAGSLAIMFVEHYEACYMEHKESRAHFCTYVIHLLLHLAEAMEQVGPLICCSQYWVEKFLGWISQRMHGRKLAAESFLKSSVFIESCKSYFQIPFYEDPEDAFHREVVAAGGYKLAGNGKNEKVNRRILRLIACYLTRKYEGVNDEKSKLLARQVVSLRSWKKLTFVSGGGTQTASVLNEKKSTRPSHFVATEMEENEGGVSIYYGRVLQILVFKIEPASDEPQQNSPWYTKHEVAVLDWASNLLKGSQNQVYKQCARKNAFSSATMEDVSIIRRLISVVEHAVPELRMESRPSSGRSSRNLRRRKGSRTYFIDSMIREHALLSPGVSSPDGVDRRLKGF